ncbi:MAG TPA: hypothetical protein VJ603_09505 [Paucimonas sp.]|nr:hypothetical protein [Paucimonas sp.]
MNQQELLPDQPTLGVQNYLEYFSMTFSTESARSCRSNISAHVAQPKPDPKRFPGRNDFTIGQRVAKE